MCARASQKCLLQCDIEGERETFEGTVGAWVTREKGFRIILDDGVYSFHRLQSSLKFTLVLVPVCFCSCTAHSSVFPHLLFCSSHGASSRCSVSTPLSPFLCLPSMRFSPFIATQFGLVCSRLKLTAHHYGLLPFLCSLHRTCHARLEVLSLLESTL